MSQIDTQRLFKFIGHFQFDIFSYHHIFEFFFIENLYEIYGKLLKLDLSSYINWCMENNFQWCEFVTLKVNDLIQFWCWADRFDYEDELLISRQLKIEIISFA